MKTATHTQFGQREWDLVYRVALGILRAPDQAEDAAQDALLRAYRKRDSFAGNSKFESWLYRIAHNTALTHLRCPHRRRRALPINENAALERYYRSAAPEYDSPESITRVNRISRALATCLAELSCEDEAAFVERYLLGTTERELGRMLGVTPNAAKQRAFRARRRVRARLTAPLSRALPQSS